jgi:hypothetical protein
MYKKKKRKENTIHGDLFTSSFPRLLMHRGSKGLAGWHGPAFFHHHEAAMGPWHTTQLDHSAAEWRACWKEGKIISPASNSL